jgi:hypothetical protein
MTFPPSGGHLLLSATSCILANTYRQYKELCLVENVNFFFDKNQDIHQILTVIPGKVKSEKVD